MARITLPPGADTVHLKNVYQLALELMAEHGLRPGQPGGWTFKFDRAKTRAGHTSRKDKTISVSAPLASIWPMSESRDTILHEIAHALTSGSHTAAWRKVALEIGCNGMTCSNPYLPGLASKYVGYCPNGHEYSRNRLTRRALRVSCSVCSPRFNAQYLITWKERNAK